ncbi:ubiquinone/menaquinone biosynthesis methyltransferase [Myxococcota bacterium]|nr:ubiquinone/menaquinone biosynthesis methyltransferase [Myxococcota bacterium]
MALNALPGAEAKRGAVRDMFDRIAPRYDRMNRLISAGLDQRWRRAALDHVDVRTGDRLLDLACGTGDFAEHAAARGAQVLGIDFAAQMLRNAQHRGISAQFTQADATALPVADASATALTCGFALRNFVALPEVFAEMARVLEPGGRFALLEVDRPRNPLIAAGHTLYFDRFVPRLGAWLSDRDAYAYLPQSTVYLPPEAELLQMLAAAGFVKVHKRSLLLGAVQLLTGVRGETR